MSCFNFKFVLAILLFGFVSFSCEEEKIPSEVDRESLGEEGAATAEKPNLSTDELAAALQLTWAEFKVPGSIDDSYMVGVVIEFGDGRKAQSFGKIGPFSGGTRVKVFSQTDEERLSTTITGSGTTGSWPNGLENPFEGTLLSNNGKLIGIDEFLMKGTTEYGDGGVNSDDSLLENEAWLKIRYEKRPMEVSGN